MHDDSTDPTTVTPGRIDPGAVYDGRTAAKALHPNLSPRTLERWRQLGTGPRYVRIGRRPAYLGRDLIAYLERGTR
jgi:hypothetical protein